MFGVSGFWVVRGSLWLIGYAWAGGCLCCALYVSIIRVDTTNYLDSILHHSDDMPQSAKDDMSFRSRRVPRHDDPITLDRGVAVEA